MRGFFSSILQSGLWLMSMMFSTVTVAETLAAVPAIPAPVVQHGAVLQEESDKPLLVHPNQKTVTIRLGSNPSTGFSWFLLNDDAVWLKPLNRHFVIDKSKNKKWVGVSGVEEWRFRVLPVAFAVPTIIRIRLMYARPSQLQTGRVRQITLVTVPE